MHGQGIPGSSRESSQSEKVNSAAGPALPLGTRALSSWSGQWSTPERAGEEQRDSSQELAGAKDGATAGSKTPAR